MHHFSPTSLLRIFSTCRSLLLTSYSFGFLLLSLANNFGGLSTNTPQSPIMLSFGKIILAVTAILAAVVSASPVAQKDDPALLNGAIDPIETKIPKTKVYKGKDPGRLPVPTNTATPTPSPRYNAPIKIVQDI